MRHESLPHRLQEWLTLQDAARHFSTKIGQAITEADVLRFGLDGHLQLSFQFVNANPATRGTVVLVERGPAAYFPTWFGSPRVVRLAPNIADRFSKVVVDKAPNFGLDVDIEWLDGVWDLLMIQDGPRAVEGEYQRMTGGPNVWAGNGDGILVASTDGRISRLVVELNADRKSGMPKNVHLAMTSPTNIHNYILSHALPMGDGRIVVRIDALAELEDKLRGTSNTVGIAQIPDMIARAIHPWRLGEAELITAQRLAAVEAWTAEVRKAIFAGELPYLSPSTMLPMGDPEVMSLPNACTTWAALRSFLNKRGISLTADPLPASLQTPPRLEVSIAQDREVPISRAQHQEREILRVIRELHYDPLAMPENRSGKDGVKLQVRQQLNFTDATFDHAWKRLLQANQIAYVS